jgi:WD40 repeat protein
MPEQFKYDVFLSHSWKDKAVVRAVAERLRADGLRVWFDEWEIKPGDSIPAKIEEGLERSRVLVLCMSANAFASDWAQLEAGTFRFRDPLNKELRFIPLRFDNAPVKGSLAQFLHINWLPDDREQEYAKLLEACRPAAKLLVSEVETARDQIAVKTIQLDYKAKILAYAFSPNGKLALTGASDQTMRLWDVESGHCLRLFKEHTSSVREILWSHDERRALTCSENGSVRLWDMQTNEFVGFGKGSLTNREMDVFRLLARGISANEMSQILRLNPITIGFHLQAAKNKFGLATRNELRKVVAQFYLSDRARKLNLLEAHISWASALAWDIERDRAFSDEYKHTIRFCSRCGEDWIGANQKHNLNVWRLAWSTDQSRVFAGANDNTVRLWDVKTGSCLRVLEGHTDLVSSIAWSANQRYALSGSADRTMRLWDVDTGRCLSILKGHTNPVRSVAWSADGLRTFSGDENGGIRVWDMSEFVSESRSRRIANAAFPPAPDQVQYTNAKVLLVGDSGVGKSGLSNFLAHGIKVEDDKPLSSTDGAWATHWPLPHPGKKHGVDREIWLWDFAGQVDYGLVHQLFMDDTAAAVLVFNPQSENPFDGLGHWDRDLQKAARKPFAKVLAAGRIDRGGLVVSAASIKKFMAERGFGLPLHLTSAKTGEGCDGLREAIVKAIDWKSIPETTSPALYHRMKQEILRLRDRGLVLIRRAELKQRMEMTLGGEDFKLEELEAAVSLLAGPGMIQRLDFGGFILLRPEVLSRYAAAVVRKVRKHPQEMGCIREDEMLAGDLDYQDFKRLPREDEAVVLRTLLDTFISRAWCLRQPCNGTALLTFPSYFRRERKEQPNHPSVLVTYRFAGPTEDIYATLVVRLHHTVAFQSTDLWKSAADFQTQTGAALGFTLTRGTEGTSRVEVYFEPDVDANSRVLFLRYVHDHLTQHAQNVVRLRHYACGNKKCDAFSQPFADQAKIDKALTPNGKGRVFCSDCGKPISLRDTIEEKFDSPAVKEQVRGLQLEGQAVIDNESRELLAVHHTGFIVAEAGQIYRGYTNSDHGIDGEIEFKDDKGRASGKRLYVQLKSGDSYLKKRRRDAAEVFQIKNLRWADYWQQQAYRVMLVIRTSDGEIRWMDVSAYLKRERASRKPVKQIVFKGERLDVMSVRGWRDKLLRQPLP